ncbi:MAG: glycosyltransferase family 2 protein [Pirellulaceae bacterium]
MSIAIQPNRQLDSILARLESLQSLVKDELQIYQRLPSIGTELAEKVVSIVIPVYNEQASVARVISRVAALSFTKEIIVVDDASTDETCSILQRLEGVENLKLIFKKKNEGKGAALRDGFAMATGDIVLVQDADLEYDPQDIPNLLRPILQDEADVVFGSRYIGKDKPDGSAFHRFGNWLLTASSNLFTGTQLTDMETCYKVFRRSVLKDITLKQNRFGIEPELTAKIARRGYRIMELPIRYQARGYQDGKKIGVRDLFKTIYCIVRYGISD